MMQDLIWLEADFKTIQVIYNSIVNRELNITANVFEARKQICSALEYLYPEAKTVLLMSFSNMLNSFRSSFCWEISSIFNLFLFFRCFALYHKYPHPHPFSYAKVITTTIIANNGAVIHPDMLYYSWLMTHCTLLQFPSFKSWEIHAFIARPRATVKSAKKIGSLHLRLSFILWAS
jgi:hypothetical protein